MTSHDVIICYSDGSKETHQNISAERATELEASANADLSVDWVTVTETDSTSVRSGIADREYPLAPARRVERAPGEFEGAWTMWQDGRQTYVLQWGTGAAAQVHGWQLADWTDTAIMAVEALRLDRDQLDASFVGSALANVRKLKSALGAIEDGLLMAARTTDPATGRELLSWRKLASEMGIDHSTIAARHARLMDGERPDWWNWLTQNVAPLLGEESE